MRLSSIDWQKALTSQMAKPDQHVNSCGCVGPQNGQPLCPCKMSGVKIKDGRYVMPERDLGPVSPWDEDRP